jgi:hypothetical protein
MRLALVLLAGCWSGEPAAPHAATAITYRFEEPSNLAGNQHVWWRVAIDGDHYDLVHDGVTQRGAVARGPGAMDLLGPDGNAVLRCHRHTFDLHPVNAVLTVACSADRTEATPAWSQPAVPREGWVCSETGMFSRADDIVLVENATIEALVHICWDYDYATSFYRGYRVGH